MEKDSGTRSGLLWEVERILEECKQEGSLPKILLMENVPEVVGTNNIEHFKKWREKLEELGYSNYDEILNAKDYGIPQNRRRCFMISVLGEYNYSFSTPIPLKIRLKDLLEKNVDRKFYLSSDKLQRIQSWGGYEDPLKDVSSNRVCSTITTHCGKDSNGMQLVEENYIETYDYAQSDTLRPTEDSRTHIDNDVSGTLLSSGNHNGVLIVGNYSPSNHNAARVVDQEGLAPTVMENHGTVTAIVEEGNLKRKMCNELIASGKVKENDVIRHSYSSRGMKGEMKDIQQNNISPTLDTSCDCLDVVVDDNPIVKQNLRIRKLTPKECFRLMGVKDEDYDNIAKNQSDASLYHLAGDSIVVNVLMAIFKQLL